MRRAGWLVLVATFLAGPAAAAGTEGLVPRAAQESAPVTIRDSRKGAVTFRVPYALLRGANAYRLYGARPLTLHDRGRRRDLYRDAFLELATRSRLAPPASAWDPLASQQAWLRGLAGAGASHAVGQVLPQIGKQLETLPAGPHAAALGQALGKLVPELELVETLRESLRIRALATDQAEARLARIGAALRLEDPAIDPALREGYHAARREFERVRQGVWPAIVTTLQKRQGLLLASTVKDLALSPLGHWSFFGQMLWTGVEGAVNAEHRGQYAICLATVAARLGEAGAAAAEHLPEALYAELALNYQLTEALKDGQFMGLKAAGGRTASTWRVQSSVRYQELRQAFAPPAAP